MVPNMRKQIVNLFLFVTKMFLIQMKLIIIFVNATKFEFTKFEKEVLKMMNFDIIFDPITILSLKLKWKKHHKLK
jgi:hypothetical protein